MKKLFNLLAGVFLFAASALAQSAGPVSLTGSQCATISTFNQMATVAINVSGTWSTTLLTQGSVQAQSPFTVLVTPAASSVPQSNITANGAYTVSVAGLSTFQVCGSSLTGTAVVTLTASPAFSPLSVAGGSFPSSTAGGVAFSLTATPPVGTISETHCTTMGYPAVMWTPITASASAQQACIDNTTATADSTYTWLISRRTFFKDGGNAATQSGKNAFISVNHLAGIGTDATNQDRAIWVLAETPTGDAVTRFAVEGIQAEVDINGTNGPSGGPDGEATAGSFQLADFHTATGISGPGFGFNAVRGSYFREIGAGNFSCTGAPCMAGGRFEASNLSTVAGGTNAIAGITVLAQDVSGGVAMQGFGAYVRSPTGASHRFTTSNYGIGIENFGTNAADFNLDSFSTASEQGKMYLEGKTLLNHIQTGGPNRAVANPTCASTGSGTSPACAMDTGSNDSSGTMTVTAGTTPGASGTITLTYNATYGTNSTTCLVMGSNAGTGSWNARVSFIGGTMNTGSAVINWDNNAVNLTAASTYKVNYHCFSK